MTISANPSGTPIPAPIAASLLEIDGDDNVSLIEGEFVDDTSALSVAVTVLKTAVDVTVTRAILLLFGSVEPEVRLKITSPASTGNAA